MSSDCSDISDLTNEIKSLETTENQENQDPDESKQHQSMWFPLFNFHHTTHHLRHLQHHQNIGNIRRSIDMTQQQSAKLDDTQQLFVILLYRLVIGSPKFFTSLSAEELWITLRRFEPSLVALDARIVVNWNTALETVV